jgi:hypothetical protein
MTGAVAVAPVPSVGRCVPTDQTPDFPGFSHPVLSVISSVGTRLQERVQLLQRRLSGNHFA